MESQKYYIGTKTENNPVAALQLAGLVQLHPVILI